MQVRLANLCGAVYRMKSECDTLNDPHHPRQFTLLTRKGAAYRMSSTALNHAEFASCTSAGVSSLTSAFAPT